MKGIWMVLALVAVGGCTASEGSSDELATRNDPFASLAAGPDRSIPLEGPDAGRFVGPRAAIPEPRSIGTILPGHSGSFSSAATVTHTRSSGGSFGAAPAAGSRPRCYTGPRGGTFTKTASGERNYGGC